MPELHYIADDEREALQGCLLHMLKDVDAVCRKHDITYTLGGGTALGAVRHKGFIPWDDDLDINMPRDDYERFKEIMQDELGCFYDFSCPNSKHVDYPFLKIYKKNTRFVELFDNMEFDGVWIDVFPIDYAPNNKLIRCLKGYAATFLLYGLGISLFLSNNKNSTTQKMYAGNARRKLRYYFALMMGRMFLFWNYKDVFNFFDRFVGSATKTNIMTVPTGRKYYLGECLPVQTIYPVKKIKFCDLDVPVYHDVEKYLTSLYGDYMQIPPVEKREKHLVADFSIDKNNIRWKTN